MDPGSRLEQVSIVTKRTVIDAAYSEQALRALPAEPKSLPQHERQDPVLYS